MNLIQVLKKNYQQILLVFAAFLLMVVTSCFFAGMMMRKQLVNSANELLNTAEANIKSILREPETALTGSVFSVQNILLAGEDSRGAVTDYLAGLTDWFLAHQERIPGLIGFYGVFRGDFVSGVRWTPDADYVPEERPWYRAARKAGKQTAFTEPYKDAYTGDIIVSLSHELWDKAGEFLGVIALDVRLTELTGYVTSLRLSEDGYGFLLKENLETIVYPEGGSLNVPLGELSDDYALMAEELENGKTIETREIREENSGRVILFIRQLYNGWYLGLATPASDYYRDMRFMILFISLLGFFFMLLLSCVLLRLSAAKMRSDEENKSKSSFLARMSHDIRTPMNAVIGMSELALREETLPRMAEYLADIKQAGLNLLSLINDILDFSKIEAGNFEIIPAPYIPASLINDVINVVRVRISEKPILFTVNVDAGIPNTLIGDEARIRQVLLNLLSNAAKYTHEGYIMLTISASFDASGDEPRLTLSVEVADSGIGIKKEDLAGLFGSFVRLDAERNKNIEGTGLGLAITRSLCQAMGGNITVSSEYGKGSVFTVLIPQGYCEGEKLAAVKDPGEKRILFYDNRALYAESVFITLEDLKAPVTVTTDTADFLDKLEKDNYPFAFVSIKIMADAAALIKKLSLKTVLVLLADLGEISSFQDVPVIIMPAWAVPIANILNGIGVDDSRRKAETRFIAPSARILIVDDIATNLKVAEGLLSIYRTDIHTCTGGEQALALVKEHRYDLVFMDHMMPGMDGIEATAAIRSWEETRNRERAIPARAPIIALTANAVVGMKEMFLAKGFDDFLTKPIEISKLDEIMARWIPKEKREKAEGARHNEEPSSLSIPGVDTRKGIAMTGGAEAGYRKVLAQFYKDAVERLPVFAAIPAEGELAAFAAQAHAIKSAAGTIGAAEISAEAAALEAAGKAGDMETIHKTLPLFRDHLRRLIEEIGKVKSEDSPTSHFTPHSSLSFRASLPALRSALEAKNMKEIDRLLEEMEGLPLEAQTRERINAVSDKVLMGEYQKALNEIDKLLEGWS